MAVSGRVFFGVYRSERALEGALTSAPARSTWGFYKPGNPPHVRSNGMTSSNHQCVNIVQWTYLTMWSIKFIEEELVLFGPSGGFSRAVLETPTNCKL